MNKTRRPKEPVFLFRVETRDKKNKSQCYLAEVRADCNENARRKIVHTVLERSGRVLTIVSTNDRNVYAGESPKQYFN